MPTNPRNLLSILGILLFVLAGTISVPSNSSNISTSVNSSGMADYYAPIGWDGFSNSPSASTLQFSLTQFDQKLNINLAQMTAKAKDAFKAIVSYLVANLTACDPDSKVIDTAGFNEDTAIDVWYGLNQTFGGIGQPQELINILGNVSDPDGILSLSYTLNGGSATSLSIGPDSYRLESTGDFNIEIAFDDLSVGSNTVVISATDTLSAMTTETVTVEFEDWNTWPLPYTVDWSAQTSISDAAQIVDGLWTLEADSVRPTIVGYDRLIAIGEMTWQDYEVVVPITIHSVPDPNKGGVGMIVRWQGHFLEGAEQPRTGWWNLGAYGYYRYRISGDHLILRLGQYDIDIDLSVELDFGTTYLYKLRVETPGGPSGGLYRLKVWEQGQPEPVDWQFTDTDEVGDMTSGSLLLVAHHVDASFGDVSVISTDGATYPLTINVVGGGQVVKSPDKANYDYGEQVTLTANPDAGWSFSDWSGSVSSVNNPVTFTITGSHEVIATFEQDYLIFLPIVIK